MKVYKSMLGFKEARLSDITRLISRMGAHTRGSLKNHSVELGIYYADRH